MNLRRRRPAFALALLAALLTSACSRAAGDGGPRTPDPAALEREAPLLSRQLPVFATSGDAAALSDADYNTVLRSRGVPVRLCWDLSALPPPRRERILFTWFNDNYGYDHALIGRPGYNNAGDYDLEASSAPGGGAPPTDGFVTLVQVRDNTRHSRQHLLSLRDRQWLCMHVTRSDGSFRNTDVALQADLFELSRSTTPPGILFVGDSISAAAMDHNGPPALSEQIAAIGGRRVPYENAGWPGATSGQLHAQLPAWLQDFPGRYVALQIGTNDKDAKPEDFRANLLQIVRDVQSAGKVLVIAPVPYSTAPDHAPYTARLNAVIAALLREHPEVLAGPDINAEFRAHPEWRAADGVHDTPAGSARRRAAWAAWFATRPDIASGSQSGGSLSGASPPPGIAHAEVEQ